MSPDAVSSAHDLPAFEPSRPDQRVTLAHGPEAGRFILRGDAAADAIEAVGWLVPRRPCRSEVTGTRAALWLGPDEWLLMDESDRSSATKADALSPALAGVAGSLVDVTHRQIGISVSGPCAADALGMFVPLDLAPAAFAVGMVARTVFEKAEIVLWRRGPDRFQVEVWRSFAPYVATLLRAGAAELQAGAGAPQDAARR